MDQDEIDAADLLTLIQNDEFDTIDATSAIKFTGSGDQRRLVFSDSSFLTSPSPRLEFLDLPSTLKLGDQLEIVLHFDQSIGDVDQNSSLTFPDGVVAAYQADRSDPQAGELHFRYQVQEGDILNGSFSDDSVTFSQENVTDNYLPANTNLSDDIDLTIDGVSPVLMRIAAPSQIFSRNQTISFSLEFSEPVTAQNDSVPSLRMTNGMQANLTTDSSSASSTQQFDLLIADNITDTQELRIDALLGQFVDRAGNLFEASTLPSLEEPPRIAPWMLDVDGDNRLSLYTDGIMIIRTLIGLPDPTSGFGSSFFGAFHGRHSAEVTRQNLTSMFEAGFFDFDQNGTQSLYTDGIQLIRYLVNPSLLNPISSDAILGQNSPFISASDLIPHFNQLNPELI